MNDPSFLILGIFIGAVVGGMIGSTRNQLGSGLVWGTLLGPVGWIIVLCLPNKKPKCPECRGVIPDDARRCLHCGFIFPTTPLPKPATFAVNEGVAEEDALEKYKRWKAVQPKDNSPAPTMGNPVEEYKAWKQEHEK